MPTVVNASESAPATLVLVTNHRDAAIIPLLRSELESLGLTVETVDRGEAEVIPRDLKRAAHDRNAVAAVRVLVSTGVVEVWIADRVTGKVVLREVLPQAADSKVSESTVVLRVVELLRASLMEVDAPHAPRGEVAPPPPLYKMVGYPESSGKLRLEMGPAVVLSAGGVGPSLAAEFDVGYRMSNHFTLDGFGAMSIIPGEISGAEGTAEVLSRIFALGMEAHTPASGSTWQPFARASLGLLSLSSKGDARTPYVGYQRDDAGLAVLVGFGTRVHLTRNLAISATIQGLRALQPVAMQFNDTTVARFGMIAAVGSLGVVLAVP
jgi:hypothetical protein